MAPTETTNRAMATSATSMIVGQDCWNNGYVLVPLLPWFPLRNVNSLQASLARCQKLPMVG